MRPHHLRQGFTTLLDDRGEMLASLTLAQGVAAMLAFYETVRVDGRPLDEDGDMVLYEWMRRGDALHVSLVRQAMRDDVDAVIWQLDLCFEFETAPDDLPDASRWCPTPDAIETFGAFVRESAAYRFGMGRPARVTLKRRRVN